ncbi:MAG: hypothetical protein AB4206_15740 [Xenococcaceae cyanobacterium]
MDKSEKQALKRIIQEFIDSFELVFELDWDYTKDAMDNEYLITQNGTFLDPFPGKFWIGGNSCDWSNRDSFLSQYRLFKAYCISEGFYSQDDCIWERYE